MPKCVQQPPRSSYVSSQPHGSTSLLLSCWRKPFHTPLISLPMDQISRAGWCLYCLTAVLKRWMTPARCSGVLTGVSTASPMKKVVMRYMPLAVTASRKGVWSLSASQP